MSDFDNFGEWHAREQDEWLAEFLETELEALEAEREERWERLNRDLPTTRKGTK